MGRKLTCLNEASLGRIFQHISNNTVFGIITAFRGNYDLAENRRRNKKLENEIKAQRFGFNKVKGYYVENQKEPVVEESFIVYSTKGREDELVDFLKSACKEFNQESILLVKDGIADLWYANGEVLELGAFHPTPSELGAAFTRIKNKPFRFGDPYYPDESEATNESIGSFGDVGFVESCPIKTTSDGYSDFISYKTLRKRLQQFKENYFEGLRAETQRCKRRWEK